jgi:tetratricopeptide (TPR) repeat protein
MRRTIVAALVAAFSLSACVGRPTDPAVDQATGSTEKPARTDTPLFAPASLERTRTTNGDVFLGNLNAAIISLTARLESRSSATRQAMLARQLFLRFQILGNLPDLELADTLVSEAMTASPNAPMALFKARIDAALHRFPAALEGLDRLLVDSASPDPGIASFRLAILLAMGQIDSLPPSPGTRPDMDSFAREANVLLDQGQLNAALMRFHLAEGMYEGVNPFPLAYLHSQIGIAYLRYGHLHSARQFLEAALNRLPGLFIAKDHLAETLVELGETQGAIALYRELVESTNDPEFCGVLEGLFEQAGETEAQIHYGQCAREGFARRLTKHPAAYWHHAADYYLARGENVKAYELASLDAELRKNASSIILFARAALAINDSRVACDAVSSLGSRKLSPPELGELDLSQCSCGQARNCP